MGMASDDAAARFRALALPELAYLHRMARALTGNRHAAEDLVQETFLRGLRSFDSFRGESFRAWMAAIMRNLHRDRPMSTEIPADDGWMHELRDPAPDPEQSAVAADRAERLRSLVGALPERLREVLVLREFGGLSYAQIATALSLPVGTVMSRLAHARDDLRRAWLASGDGAVS
jgi:RNA polymerase sigma-70 factor (ECF subfamily)